MIERLFQVTRGKVTAGFIARPFTNKQGQTKWSVWDAAPILAKSCGHELNNAIRHYESVGATVKEVLHETSTIGN